MDAIAPATPSLDGQLVPLVLGAQLLGKSWHQAWRLVLTGQLRGERVRGRWHVHVADILALRKREQSQ